MTFESSTLTHSWSDSEESSSISEVQVSQLQNEILHQSKDIEKFIQNSGRDDESDSLTVLKSLFILFKSELSINLKLRTLLVDERKKNTKLANETKLFFHQLYNDGFTELTDFKSILEFLINHQNDVITLQQSAKKAIKKEKKIAKQVIRKYAEFENENKTQVSLIQEKDSLLTEQTQKIKCLEDSIESLQGLNNESANTINELKQQLVQLEKEIADKTLRITELEKQNELLKEQNQSKQSDQNNLFILNQIRSLEKEKEMLKEAQKNREIQIQHEISDLNAQNIIDIQNIKEECAAKIDQIKTQMDKLEQNYQSKINELNASHQQLTTDSNGLNETNQSLKKECEELNEQIVNLEEEKKQYIQSVNVLQKKLKKLMKRYKSMYQSFGKEHQSHKIRIDKIREQFDNQLQTSISKVEQNMNSQIEKSESKIAELQNINNEQKIEINSLKDLIRKLSFNLQQEESENARLQASLHMRKFGLSNLKSDASNKDPSTDKENESCQSFSSSSYNCV